MLSLIAALLVAVQLPAGAAPAALSLDHFPDRLHALVWRNWQITPLERMAAAVGGTPEELRAIGHSMGLEGPPPISEAQWRRSYITVIRANWHLLPYEQLLALLDWAPEELAYTLQEDDGLFIKLGRLKPACGAIKFAPPDEATRARATELAKIVRETFPDGVGVPKEPLFRFVDDLSTPLQAAEPAKAMPENSPPRFCYSYFALYGDPLLDEADESYPDGYLARLRASGVNGIWLQGVLFKLTEFPWDPALSEGYTTRLANLNKLIARAKRHGIGVYLYLNEPRSMPVMWFAGREELKGVVEGEYAALCTSHPDVQRYLRDGVAAVVRAAPELAGVFTITASESLTNCWSHHQGAACPRCEKRTAAETIVEVNALIADGVRAGSAKTQSIAWDWGWQDAWAPAAIAALPQEVALMSVSEWSLPIERGGVASEVGEYSISAVGPGPRATRHWKAAQERGLRTFAKLQVGTTWELGSVPYLPAVNDVAEHAERLRGAGVDGAMLGWTLGGYPSPNLEVTGRILNGEPAEVAMRAVAAGRFGETHAGAVLAAWKQFSDALDEYPYHISVLYNAPHHVGPANLLWAKPTGYHATMVGIPYDDLNGWRGVYPPEVFAAQFAKVAEGFDRGAEMLLVAANAADEAPENHAALLQEWSVAAAAAIQFRSAANQARFVLARDRLAGGLTGTEAETTLQELEGLLNAEIDLARRLFDIQSRDSRIGFEATNHYFFVPLDLAEKVLNCRDLLDRWLPTEQERLEQTP
ncbi:MAG: hypothetical protein H0T51_10215 [Pirellulales bacterium]|nr:hypothetical protein [Pirellulales bacterium]